MKRIAILAVFLLALPLAADVTITNTYTDAQAARITRAVNRVNAATCGYFALAPGCTTTQVRTEFCKRAGLGPGSACDGATQFIIYANVTQFDKRVLLEKIVEWQAQDAADDVAAAKAAFEAKTQPEKDAICVALGLTAGCSPF